VLDSLRYGNTSCLSGDPNSARGSDLTFDTFDDLRERRRVEQFVSDVLVRSGAVEVARGECNVAGKRLRINVAERLPVGDAAFVRLYLGFLDLLNPFGVVALVELTQELLAYLGAVAEETVLVESSDDVGDLDFAVVVEALDFAVLV